MGVGKTTIGRLLAQKIGSRSIDTDSLIEEREKKSIGDIFVEDGEAYFRNLEQEILESSMKTEGVLSLGGGACLSQRAQDLLRASGSPIIFLDISLAEVSKRVGFDKARPLLAINPRSKWQELMDQRRPIYESLADIHIVVDGLSKSEIVSRIVNEAEVLDATH